MLEFFWSLDSLLVEGNYYFVKKPEDPGVVSLGFGPSLNCPSFLEFPFALWLRTTQDHCNSEEDS